MASSAAGLITPVQVYYDKVFLDRAKIELRHDFGAQVKNVPLNSGAVVRWSRFTPLALVSSALSEATNPAETAMTSTQVSATLAEYGAVTNVSSLFSMTQIDVDLKEHVEVHGQNAGESINTSVDYKPSVNILEHLKGYVIISPWQPEASFRKLMQLI